MRGSRFAVAIAAAAAVALPAGPALAATSGHTTSTRPETRPIEAGYTEPGHTVTTYAQPPAAKTAPVVVTCASKLAVRPRSYLLACGDGSQWLSRLRWASWTAGEATARGRFTFNTCTPNCARGKFITSRVLVVLWHTSAVPRHAGRREFLMMTVIYTGKRPAHSARTFTERLWYPAIR